MTADILHPHNYALFAPAGQLIDAAGYYAMTIGGASRVAGYAIQAVASGPSGSRAYAAIANPAAIIADVSYVAHRNDVSIPALRGYVVMQSVYPPYGDLNLEYPFVEQRFPTSLSYGSSGGPGFQTSVFKVDSGVEHTQADWDRLRARYSVEFSYVPKVDLDAVENFFYAMRGQGIGFRFKDWNDYQIVKQNIAVGDGVSRTFQLFKRYRSGPAYFDRIIKKPVRGSITELYLEDELLTPNREFFINYSTGEVTFVDAPPAGTIVYLPYAEFDVPVRFATDQLSVSPEDHDQYSIDSLSLIEILV